MSSLGSCSFNVRSISYWLVLIREWINPIDSILFDKTQNVIDGGRDCDFFWLILVYPKDKNLEIITISGFWLCLTFAWQRKRDYETWSLKGGVSFKTCFDSDILLTKKPRHISGPLVYFCYVEEEGFEPPEPCSSTVFKTAAFDRSATPLCFAVHFGSANVYVYTFSPKPES